MRLLILLVLALTASTVGANVTFTVAPNGSDANPGTPTKPFASLTRARNAIRALAAKPAGGVTVTLRAGSYRANDTFRLEAQDSGTAANPIVYRSAPGEVARLTGGKQIPASAFKPVTDPSIVKRLDPKARNKVVQANLKDLGVTDFGELKPFGFGAGDPMQAPELFVNGKAMTIARWPNKGWIQIDKVVDRGSVWGSNVPGDPELHEKPDRGAIFELKDARIERWTQAKDVWLFGYWWWDWAESALQLDWVDTQKQLLKTVQPHTYGVRAGGRYYVYNLLEEIDTPGEWYLDRSTGILYLYPPSPISQSNVELSLLDKPMVQLTDVSHVTLQGLTFETTRDTVVSIQRGEACTVAGCTFRKTARGAVSVEGGVKHRVADCDIYDTNGGIYMHGGDRRTLTPSHHVAANNHIYNWSRIKMTYNPSITLSGVGGLAAHNRIHNGPHMAIGFSGNDHVIEYNEIYDVCQLSNDAGAIYTGRNWSMRGNVIRYNFFHDIFGLDNKGAAAVYLDDCFSSADVIGNVFFRMTGLSFLIGGGRDNVIENNITVQTGPLSIDDRGLNWAKSSTGPSGDMPATLKEMPYQQEPWASRYPRLVNILEDDPGCPKGNIARNNVFVKTRTPDISEAARKYGTVENNWVTQDDPGFVDMAGSDFRLRKDAAVFKHVPGFKPIPMQQIGLVRTALRAVLPPLPPVVQPSGRTFVGTLAVTIATRTPGAVVRYTVDGSQPTAASPIYRQPIVLAKSATVRAIAQNGSLLSDAVSVEYKGFPLGGGKAVPISGLEWTDNAGYTDPKRDVNFEGTPLSVAGQKFERGLFMHPAETPNGGRAFAVFPLEGGLAKAKRFKASVGVDDDAKGRGSVAFIVEAYVGNAWRKLIETPVLKGGDKPFDIDVDVHGASKLRLTVTDGGDNINSDHATWGNARLE